MNKLQATVVLKGNGTLVSRQEAPPLVLDCGNPGMAVAGMGDVLSGIIGALLAQGIAADEAAFLGAWWHGHTADLLARGKGQVGLLPTEVIATLRSEERRVGKEWSGRRTAGAAEDAEGDMERRAYARLKGHWHVQAE